MIFTVRLMLLSLHHVPTQREAWLPIRWRAETMGVPSILAQLTLIYYVFRKTCAFIWFLFLPTGSIFGILFIKSHICGNYEVLKCRQFFCLVNAIGYGRKIGSYVTGEIYMDIMPHVLNQVLKFIICLAEECFFSSCVLKIKGTSQTCYLIRNHRPKILHLFHGSSPIVWLPFLCLDRPSLCRYSRTTH